MATPERTWRGRAPVTSALVAIERRAFDEAGQYLRQARREVRGINAPLVAWRIEAMTATLLERTAQPDSARRARQKYERALERLNRPAAPDPGPERRRTRAVGHGCSSRFRAALEIPLNLNPLNP